MSRAVVAVLLFGLAGCLPPPDVGQSPPTIPAGPVNEPRVLTGNPEISPAAASSPQTAVAPATAPAGKPIQLSLGTALPQSLPETSVGFSVLYRVSGQLNPQSEYVWVIHRTQGADAEIPILLKQADTLQVFQPWRPEEGPFESWIEERTSDGKKTEVSPRIPMT